MPETDTNKIIIRKNGDNEVTKGDQVNVQDRTKTSIASKRLILMV